MANQHNSTTFNGTVVPNGTYWWEVRQGKLRYTVEWWEGGHPMATAYHCDEWDDQPLGSSLELPLNWEYMYIQV